MLGVGSKPFAAAVAALILAAAVVFVGCGASQTIDPVARAADVTAQVPGYRLAATINVSTSAGPAQMTMAGLFDRANRTGVIDAQESIAGHQLHFTEVFSGLTFYLRSSGLAGLNRLTGGKRWLKFDMSRMLGAMGLGSLPTAGTDPTQFVDFLRAVSSSTKKVGTDTVRGVSTTHYHATIDLGRYPKLLPAGQQAAAQRSVSTLESALGGHMLPIDAWIDNRNLVRRIGLNFSECVASQHVQFGMTMDLYGYGLQPRTQLPASRNAFDLTPLLASSLSKLKFGCARG